MFIKLEPNHLGRYLWRWGPFIYFYNAESEGPNKRIVNYINAMTSVYPRLDVIEINWKTQISKIPKTNLQDKNKVFLYFKGSKQIEENEPNESEIRNIFYLCAKFYNQKIENKANNIGIKGRIDCPNRRNNSLSKKKIYYQPKEKLQAYILKKKIDIFNDEKIAKFIHQKLSHQSKNMYKTELKDVIKQPIVDHSKNCFNHTSPNSTKTYTVPTIIKSFPMNSTSNYYPSIISKSNDGYIISQILPFNYIPINVTITQNESESNNEYNGDCEKISNDENISEQTTEDLNSKNKNSTPNVLDEGLKNDRIYINSENKINSDMKKNSPNIFEEHKYSKYKNNDLNHKIEDVTKNFSRRKSNSEPTWFYDVNVGDLPLDIIN